ncbi:MAG: translation initiation factor IF-3 [Candidatus Kerfeldbacteria bacterium]|nr:translation initiation factor IF-3 [Candidatus Kerfeldbacteria bacterium]
MNHQIRVPEVRLIDDTNQQVGIVKLQDALRMARERGMDLVEVSPVAQPPVCRILDYGKLIYQQERQSRQLRIKQKKVELKGIRISLKIGQHDLQMRESQSRKFLDAGNKVKIELILRGRENAHQQRAREIINQFIERLGPDVRVEQATGKLGNRLTTIIAKSSHHAKTEDA